jgi:hypothetical protein
MEKGKDCSDYNEGTVRCEDECIRIEKGKAQFAHSAGVYISGSKNHGAKVLILVL